eukprot:m.205155 g.205155  ORF g.205155 m.205155 type:complete len:298 (+) comp22820_c0_seq1:47-940(+)
MAANFWKGSQCAKWMLDEAVLEKSRQQDAAFLSSDNHVALTFLFSDVIRSLADVLRLRQQVVATATMYFKRFYLKHSWTSIHPFLMAQTCVYLAAKVEECGPISARTVVHRAAVDVLELPKFKSVRLLPPDRPKNFDLDEIIDCEFFLVQAMDCCLIVFHPYRSLVEFAHKSGTTDRLLPLAWNIVNDSCKSDLCFLYPPYLIALGSLQVASTVLKGTAGDGADQDFTRWFADSLVNVSTTEVMEVVQALLDLYASLSEYRLENHAAAALDAVHQETTRLRQVDDDEPSMRGGAAQA